MKRNCLTHIIDGNLHRELGKRREYIHIFGKHHLHRGLAMRYLYMSLNQRSIFAAEVAEMKCKRRRVRRDDRLSPLPFPPIALSS